MKVYKSLEEKIDHVLDNVICNLEPVQAAQMRMQLLLEDLKINQLISKARNLLLPTKERPIGRYYWLARGWSVAVAQAKITEARKKKKPKKSPFSVEFWLDKINPDTGLLFTCTAAEFKRNSLRPIRAEYWILKGFSLEEAVIKALETKSKNNSLGAEAVKSRNKSEIRSFSPRCVEYWTARGYSEENAVKKVKEEQTTFSLEKCISKHGKEDGKEVWLARQKKWLDNLNSKSTEEIDRINRSKLAKGFSISLAEKDILSTLQKHFPAIQDQVMVRNGHKRFLFDIGLDNKLIEYNGTYWHADPRFYNELVKVRNMTAADVREKDKIKLETAMSQGYEVLVIWEHDFKENKQREIEKCINFLTQ